MPSFALLDVAIALVFLYLLLSLISSAANELVSALLQARAKLLEKGIIRLLDSEDLKNKLYDHALLRNLHSQEEPWLIRVGRRERPAYIPARSFALAMMDLIEPGKGTLNALLAPNHHSEGPPSTLLASLQSVNSILPEKPKQALVCLIQAAGADAVRTRQSIEDWYNSTMDRVSGAYKRRTQFTIFCIGLLATIFVNADTISVAKRLAASKTLSEAITHSASSFAEHAASNTETDATKQFTSTLATLDKVGFPIGWSGLQPEDTPPSFSSRAGFWIDCWNLFWLHSAGWIITAFAISFGAPFWFDVLNRFMVVRSTVKPQEKSGAEAPKEPVAAPPNLPPGT